VSRLSRRCEVGTSLLHFKYMLTYSGGTCASEFITSSCQARRSSLMKREDLNTFSTWIIVVVAC